MQLSEKLELVEEILEEAAKPDDDLSKFPAWDSMAALSLVVVLEENFGRTDVSSKALSELRTVNDILDLME